jgi:hypothetical protein
MPIRNYIKVFIVAFVVVSCCFVEADAQTKKKRTRRSTKPAAAKPVITNPPVAPPDSQETPANDVKIISTADPSAEPTETQSTDPAKKPAAPAQPTGSEQDMQRTINKLSNQVDRLNDKLGTMQDDDRYQLDMERLTRAEQRSEQLRSQLLDTETKTADIESRLEQIEYAIKPENIDRATQGYGSTRPEEAREARRRQLETDRTRLRSQLKILETSKTRLETAVSNSDAEVDLLRAKLQQRREQMEANPTPPSTEKRTRKPQEP